MADLEKARQRIIVRKDRTQRFFSTVAPQWEGLKKEVLGDFDLNGVLRERLSGRTVIADLGCGTGELLGLLFRDSPEGIIGVDASPEMLEQARMKLAARPGVELRLGEVEYLPMKDMEVDAVVMSMVLYHILQPEKAVAEVHRVLKPGGTFLLADFQKHNRESVKEIIGGAWLGFDRTQVETWLAESGFRVRSMDRFKVEQELTIHLFAADKL